MCTQGFISGLALIPPWALQECRPYRALFILLSVCTQGFISGFALIPPWAMQECRPYRALFILLSVCTQGSISGFALIPPWALQECRPCRAHCRIGRLRCCVVVLCSLNVLGCVNGLLRSFVYLFDFDCMGCGIGDCLGRIDWCGRAMSPKGAILLHSPGRKPWVRYVKTYFEPR